jgi:type VI protein secretion system component Hcp
MTIDGIPGESPLFSDAWTVGRAEPALFGPFVVTKAIDGASSALLARFASGQHMPKVTLKLLQPGSDAVHTTYVLRDAVLSSFGLAGDGPPLERLGFDAARVESTTPVAGGEPLRSCYDRVLDATC